MRLLLLGIIGVKQVSNVNTMQKNEIFPSPSEDVEDDIEQAVERSYGRKIAEPLKQSDPTTDETAGTPDAPDPHGGR